MQGSNDIQDTVACVVSHDIFISSATIVGPRVECRTSDAIFQVSIGVSIGSENLETILRNAYTGYSYS